MPAIFANRSPKLPIETARTRSPGDSVLTIAVSSPPEPAEVSIATSLVVPKNGFIPSRIRASIAANSGPRWLIIWRAPASRTDGGRAVGPGIRRLGSKRSTAVSWIGCGAGGAAAGAAEGPPRWSQKRRVRATMQPDPLADAEVPGADERGDRARLRRGGQPPRHGGDGPPAASPVAGRVAAVRRADHRRRELPPDRRGLPRRLPDVDDPARGGRRGPLGGDRVEHGPADRRQRRLLVVGVADDLPRRALLLLCRADGAS